VLDFIVDGFSLSNIPIRILYLYKKKKSIRETYLGSLSKGDRWRKSNTTQGGRSQRRKALNQNKDESIHLHILLRGRANIWMSIALPVAGALSRP
jgi:hypothetical protein